jgi:apolipoprotein N-acyltransferase
MDLKKTFVKIFSFLKKEYYLLSVPLIFLSFPSYDAFFMKLFPFWAWVSLVPLFHYAASAPLRGLYLKTFLMGLLANYLCFSWIGHFGAKVPGGYAVILSALIPALTVFFTLKIIAAEWISRRFPSLRFLIYPSVWIIIDWIQSIGFLAFPWPYWGYSQYPFTPFIQLASFTGIYGITFVLITSNILIAEFIKMKYSAGPHVDNRKFAPESVRLMVLGGFAALVITGGAIFISANPRPPQLSESRKGYRVAMVQSCISPWESWNINRYRYLKELVEYTDRSLVHDPDIIIWSESATLETIHYDYLKDTVNSFQNQLFDYVRAAGRPLLTGEIGIIEKNDNSGRRMMHPLNNAVFINEKGVPVKTYSKINLVPIGEWFPYEKWFPFVKKIADSFGASSFVPGEYPSLFEVDGHAFGALICYEGIFHRLCRRYRLMGADMLVNITNDGWTDTYSGHMQHYSASVFRAVENGIWMLRAGNTGYTAAVDPYGRVTGSIPILQQGYLAADVDFSMNRDTFYTMAGDIILYLAMILIAVLSIVFGTELYRNRKCLTKE